MWKCVILPEEDEKREAVTRLADRFSPDEPQEKRDAEIVREWKLFSVIRLDIEHMTGKQAKEFMTV